MEETQTYYQRNREKCLAQSKAYQEANKEHYKQYNRDYYLKRKAEKPPKPPKAPKPKPEPKPKPAKPLPEIIFLRPQLPVIQPMRLTNKMFEVSFD